MAKPSVTKVRLSADQRRAQILESATELFAERGYDAISVGEIAAAADCSKAVLYDHFASKQELAIAAVEQHNLDLLRHVAEAVAGAADEPQAVQYERGIEAFFEFNEQHTAGCRLLFRDPSPDPGVFEAHSEAHRTATQGVAALMANAMERPPEDPDWEVRLEMFAHILTSSLAKLAAWSEDHPKVSRDQIVRSVMDFSWLGLERVAAGERHEPAGR